MSRTLRDAASDYREAARGGLLVAIRRRLLASLLTIEGQAKDNATTRPRVRSGILRRSIVGNIEQTGSTTAIVITAGGDGKAESYASLQEYGGVVRATRSRYLAIPVGPAKTGAGVSRYQSPREVAGLVWRPGREGGMLGKETGKGKRAKFVPWFLLRRQVTVPETAFVRRAIEAGRAGAGEAVALGLREAINAE